MFLVDEGNKREEIKILGSNLALSMQQC